MHRMEWVLGSNVHVSLWLLFTCLLFYFFFSVCLFRPVLSHFCLLYVFVQYKFLVLLLLLLLLLPTCIRGILYEIHTQSTIVSLNGRLHIVLMIPFWLPLCAHLNSMVHGGWTAAPQRLFQAIEWMWPLIPSESRVPHTEIMHIAVYTLPSGMPIFVIFFTLWIFVEVPDMYVSESRIFSLILCCYVIFFSSRWTNRFKIMCATIASTSFSMMNSPKLGSLFAIMRLCVIVAKNVFWQLLTRYSPAFSLPNRRASHTVCSVSHLLRTKASRFFIVDNGRHTQCAEIYLFKNSERIRGSTKWQSTAMTTMDGRPDEEFQRVKKPILFSCGFFLCSSLFEILD